MNIAFSQFQSIYASHAVCVIEPWDQIKTQFLHPEVVADKAAAPLVSFLSYRGQMRRGTDDAEAVTALTLDFDNARKNLGTGLKVCIENPIYPDQIETILTAWNLTFVLATSFSHTPNWPRFRVVIPLENPVPARVWSIVAPKLLKHLGLDQLPEGAIDPAYARATQIYYLPSHPEGVEPITASHDGVPLTVTDIPDVVDAPAPHPQDLEFTAEQIARWAADRLPDLEQTGQREWRFACPIHHGQNPNFCLNSQTGLWKCFKCDAHGNLIQLEGRLRQIAAYVDARKSLYDFLGIVVPAVSTRAELLTRIEACPVGEVPADLYVAIAALPRKMEAPLVAALVDQHALDPGQVHATLRIERKRLRDLSKIVDFPREGELLAKNKRDREAACNARDARREPDDWGLALPCREYRLGEDGVFPQIAKEFGEAFDYVDDTEHRVAARPIWPAAIGTDLAGGKVWVHLSWVTSRGETRQEWYPASVSNNREVLSGLDDVPFALGDVAAVSKYLIRAKEAIVAPARTLTSGIGWVAKEGKQVFVLPGDPQIGYIGPPIERRGTIEGWAEPLHELLEWGDDAWIALSTLGLSAASPLVRLVSRRNPVVGLVHESNAGKSTILNHAMAIWCESRALTIPANSTVKGTQDRSIFARDLPLLIDEMQQLRKMDPRRVEEVIYFMANGQRRVTSSRMQEVKGGERRYGVMAFAAEMDVMDRLQRGSQNRVVVLKGAPMRDRQMAERFITATNANYGVVGTALAAIYNAEADQLVLEVMAMADVIQAERPMLEGDDALMVALAVKGLELLGRACQIALPTEGVRQKMSLTSEAYREEAQDDVEVMWTLMIDMLISMDWHQDALSTPAGPLAFRGGQLISPEYPLEIVPTNRSILDLLKDNVGMPRRWAERGWIAKQASNYKWQRRNPDRQMIGGRVWRVTLAGLAVANLDEDLRDLPQEDDD